MDKITAIVWLALVIGFLVMEAVTVKLISVWFAAGSLAAMLVSLLGAPVWLQVVVFFVVSIVLLAMLWPMAKKHLKPRITATNADALIGKICLVTEDIDPMEGGRVKVGDVTWSARAETEETICTGEKVRILKIQGAKVIVEKAQEKVEV